MPSLVDNIKAVVTGMKVTLSNFLKKPVTVEYPWDQDEIPPISRGTLRMVDFHDAASISEKSAWYPGTRWAPCTEGCPAHTDARGYVTLAGEARWREGLETLRRTYPFVGTLGRVCPAPCEKKCRRNFVDDAPVSIREIKRFVGDWAIRNEKMGFIPEIEENGKRIAIVGGGPAGISTAYYLRLKGYAPVIFEKETLLGGMMRYGIPDYRLPRAVVEHEFGEIERLGVEIRTGVTIGKDVTLDDLREDGFDPSKVGDDRLYFLEDRYVPLTEAIHRAIASGEIRL